MFINGVTSSRKYIGDKNLICQEFELPALEDGRGGLCGVVIWGPKGSLVFYFIGIGDG